MTKPPQLEDGIPVVYGEYRKDFPGGIRFWCPYCRRWHLHGRGEGHRVAHCDAKDSPFNKTGYILRLKRHAT